MIPPIAFLYEAPSRPVVLTAPDEAKNSRSPRVAPAITNGQVRRKAILNMEKGGRDGRET